VFLSSVYGTGQSGQTQLIPRLESFSQKAVSFTQGRRSVIKQEKADGPNTHYDNLKRRLYDRLGKSLTTPYEDKDAKRLIKRLKRHKDELFTFLEHEGVSPYNNHAEQQMRKPVLTRRVSQQNRSDQGAKTQAIFMTLFRTAELQGKNPVETVLSIAENAIAARTDSTEYLKLAA
jgi:hypothetical protein